MRANCPNRVAVRKGPACEYCGTVFEEPDDDWVEFRDWRGEVVYRVRLTPDETRKPAEPEPYGTVTGR